MDSNCPICDRPSPDPTSPCRRCQAQEDIPGDRTYTTWSAVRLSIIAQARGDRNRKTSLEKTDRRLKPSS